MRCLRWQVRPRAHLPSAHEPGTQTSCGPTPSPTPLRTSSYICKPTAQQVTQLPPTRAPVYVLIAMAHAASRCGCAERKYPDYSPADGLRLLLANHLAPHYDLVLAEMSKTGETEIPLEGVYKKLYDVSTYTGVYKERFRSGDGRINGETDNRPGRSFGGSTNTGTNETIHDISVLMRPNLRSGTMMRSRPVTPGGSPARLARSTSPRRAAAAMGRSPSMGPGGGVGPSGVGRLTAADVSDLRSVHSGYSGLLGR